MKKSLTLIIGVVVVVVAAIAILQITGLAFGGIPTGCSDTDVTEEYPDGINIMEQGIVTYENRPSEYKDFCQSSTTVKEYYCDNSGAVKSDAIWCGAEGCVDGACVE